ncbi:DUF2939 domain-containing protein [Luteimonas aquatica]|uniref:DUF2939 domain-containing protein n=1 Tax=Luteimonas aquatica TaxID=450364 RepID=UPI001F5840F7|nr:DUF2939 domain-containing protein [Luteimonas aquatica]
MKKWLWLVVLVLVALLAYVAAGPFLTVRAIRAAVKAGDAAALSEQVDFPALRSSFKAQFADRLARQAGDAGGNPLAAFGLGLANSLAGSAIDGLVTPSGLGAMMEGRQIWDRVNNEPFRGREDEVAADGSVAAARPEPLHDPKYRFESLSRFTATVSDRNGRPMVFVFTRHGLDWKLSDIVLPQ